MCVQLHVVQRQKCHARVMNDLSSARALLARHQSAVVDYSKFSRVDTKQAVHLAQPAVETNPKVNMNCMAPVFSFVFIF